MVENIIDKIKREINSYINKSVIIIQDGFIQSKYEIKTAQLSIDNEILSIINEEKITYLKINLNQIYKFDSDNSKLVFYMDNDTIITIQKDRL